MSVITLRARTGDANDGGIEAGPSLLPERLAAGTEPEIARMNLRMGARSVELGELFSVLVEKRESGGSGGQAELRLEMDGLRIHGLGSGMRSGRLVVSGDAGERLGAAMSGGEVVVEGSCGAWAGAEMAGGLIRIRGDAGPRAGGALGGGPRGMNGGVILVGGRAGDEAGAAMRRGLIAIGGSAGARAGFHAIAGTVIVFGDVGEAPGLATKRGSLVVHGSAELLPTFRYACDIEPGFLRLILRRLEGVLAFPVPGRFRGGRYRRFAGDFSQLGKGEVLLWRET